MGEWEQCCRKTESELFLIWRVNNGKTWQQAEHGILCCYAARYSPVFYCSKFIIKRSTA